MYIIDLRMHVKQTFWERPPLDFAAARKHRDTLNDLNGRNGQHT